MANGNGRFLEGILRKAGLQSSKTLASQPYGNVLWGQRLFLQRHDQRSSRCFDGIRELDGVREGRDINLVHIED